MNDRHPSAIAALPPGVMCSMWRGVLEELGLPYRRARVINSARAAVEAAGGLRYP